MSLRASGFRFMVRPDREAADWFQLPDPRCEGWHDCTNMDDDEFYTFMTNRTGD